MNLLETLFSIFRNGGINVLLEYEKKDIGDLLKWDEKRQDVFSGMTKIRGREIGYPGNSFKGRYYADLFSSLVCDWNLEESPRFRDPILPKKAEAIADFLISAQAEDGSLNSVNFSSPPDTAFAVHELGCALQVIRQQENDDFRNAAEKLRIFMERAGEMLLSGGVHTPNHRWVVSAALSYLYSLYGRESYKKRVEEWLSEGMDQDLDGQYSERSTGIYTHVVLRCLYPMALYLHKPELLDSMRRCLDLTEYHLVTGGMIETVASRRQDQFNEMPAFPYYPWYRFLAAYDQNPRYAALARMIWDKRHPDCEYKLISLLEQAGLTLPDPGEIACEYDRFFPGSGLLRSRRDGWDISLFGGADPVRASHNGLSRNPVFAKFRKNGSQPLSLSMKAYFFDMDYYRGMMDGDVHVSSDDISFNTTQTFSVPFYQPLAPEDRLKGGIYDLDDADQRFYSCLSFHKRERSNISSLTLKTRMSRRNGKLSVRILSEGPDKVPLALELAVPKGASISGCEGLEETERFFDGDAGWKAKGGCPLFLKKGKAVWDEAGIKFGPGLFEHDMIPSPGEAPFQADPSTKDYVYLTMFSPVDYTLEIE